MDAADQVLNQSDREDFQDRISDLPRSVLTHILSRLTTKDAVATSALSKTWKMKWTCIFNLDFNDTSLYSHRVINRERFVSFVEKVLHHCGNLRIRGFHLVCSKSYNACQVTRWILTALRQGVKNFSLDYPSGNFSFPSCFLGSESLEEVTISIPWTVEIYPITSFRNLKILRLTRMKFENMDYPHSTELFFSFPALHTFCIRRCTWMGINVIKIEAPSLSIFEVCRCRYGKGDESCEIQILGGAPNLSHVKWASKDFLENFVLPTPSSVSKAVLDHFNVLEDLWVAGIGAVKLLLLVSNITRLELSIDMVESNIAWKNDDYELIGTLPPCVMCRLKKIDLTYGFGAAIGFHLMRLLLQNGHDLQLMSVHLPKLSRCAKNQIMLKLIMAPRASPYVRIHTSLIDDDVIIHELCN
ncbi:F-box/LRR-repeat protein At3g26922 [Coffea arabica]|uniref:F-box/LRR-repeat protein At3g26922 n=1 Tax=Coffea arabica TaxID=13443 RepID=A0A6P6SAJ5_COFAR|nr:F-box/LRR-repeat protein At3g26922-like [Coffea arabica]